MGTVGASTPDPCLRYGLHYLPQFAFARCLETHTAVVDWGWNRAESCWRAAKRSSAAARDVIAVGGPCKRVGTAVALAGWLAGGERLHGGNGTLLSIFSWVLIECSIDYEAAVDTLHNDIRCCCCSDIGQFGPWRIHGQTRT